LNLMNDLVAAARQHNVTCIVINGGQATFGSPYTPEQQQQAADDFAEDFPLFGQPPAEQVAAYSEELVQLRTQVQTLTSQLAAADQSLADANSRAAAVSAAPPMPQAPPEATQPQGADNPSRDDTGIEVLGFSDDAIERKLMRLGLDTVGKLAEAFGRGEDGPLWSGGKSILKKDWMIEVGMKVIAGAGPSRSASPATGGIASSDVPEGHTDRPWSARLAAARAKQTSLAEAQTIVTERQAEVDEHEQAEEEVPEPLLDALLAAEEDVKLFRAQLVATRWCLGLDPEPSMTLDQALESANLGPWMETPQPRLLED